MALVIAGAITFVRFDESGKHTSPSATSQMPRPEESRHTFGLSPANSEFLPLVHLYTPPADIPAPIERLKSFAREKRLPVVDCESLGLDISIVELLKLTPTQVELINESFRSFMQSLRSEELVHAFVCERPNGNEEIVISAFDRSALMKRFRTEVSRKGTPDIAGFLADQLPYDATLAVANAEIRVWIESGDDGADRVCFSRRIRRSDAVDDQTPVVMRGGIFGDQDVRFAPTDLLTSKGLLGKEISPRFRHLFAAAPSLPRRSPP
jgi:hypothetical protein